MSRTGIIGAVVAVALIGGGGAYLLANNDDNDKKSSDMTLQSSTDQTSSSDNSFAPVATKGLPFVATITNSGTSGNSESKIEHDGKDKTRYTSSAGGQQTEIIYTSDAYYLCSNGANCIKYPVSQSGSSGFNPADYQYDQEKLGGYKNNASYKGTQDCVAGTCDVWSVSTDGLSSTIFIDTKTKRISQVENSQQGITSKIVYEYKDVTINVPANAQAAPTQ